VQQLRLVLLRLLVLLYDSLNSSKLSVLKTLMGQLDTVFCHIRLTVVVVVVQELWSFNNYLVDYIYIEKMLLFYYDTFAIGCLA